MVSRRFAVASSDEEEDEVPVRMKRPRRRGEEDENADRGRSAKKPQRKKAKFVEEDDDYEEEEEEEEDDEEEDPEEDEEMEEDEEEKGDKSGKRKKKRGAEKDDEVEEDEEEEDGGAVLEDAKPIGEVIKVSGKGRGRKKHYQAFEYDGNRYDLETPVLLVPEDSMQKPYVAIIKEITQNIDGSVWVTGQWFYRPEEAPKKTGGNWQSRDSRELFYSSHHDAVPAESVMHKCVVHFVPSHKQLPNRKQNPGFVVQRVYDTVQKRLWKLTDKDFEEKLQHEIDILVQQTLSRIQLPDIETDSNAADLENSKSKRVLRKNMSPLDVTREDEGITKSDQQTKTETPKAETPGSCASNASEFYKILQSSNVLTGETQRDRWLEKLLQAVQFVSDSTSDDKASESVYGDIEKNLKNLSSLVWPDSYVVVVAALEQASHDTLLYSDQKYNQKMRQLVFNLKNTALLARRFVCGDLEPTKILNMLPNELKEGLTAEELAKREPEEKQQMQMTDARCKRCTEKKVGLLDIIQSGLGDRYQLECIACGNTWYASRDEVATLTIDGPNTTKNVGTAPLATTKFEDVEKKLASPHKNKETSTETPKNPTPQPASSVDPSSKPVETKPNVTPA
ncbi:unnamed protein product [Rhodiola kirilowii]